MRMQRAKNYFAWQARLVTGELGRRVVEIGCGLGNFTGQLLDRELVVALDVEPACVARIQQRYSHAANLQAVALDVTDPRFLDLARYQPDSCVCLNVLEHVEDDRRALVAMQSILRPDGVIVLIVPAFPSLYGPIDRNLGHCRRYTRSGISKLAQDLGLRVSKLRYMNLAGFFGWWLNARILKREAQSDAQIGLFDRYLVPLLSRIEDAIPPPFGQSLLVVLRTPSLK